MSDTFVRVSMEEGSKCTTSRPCWKRIVVTAAGATRIEEHDATTEGRALAPRDLARVKELADSPRFRDLLGASAPTCPSVFDYQVIFEVETASMRRLRDVHASGCLGDEYKDRPDHPYRRLKSLMDELAQQAFARP